MTKPMKNERRAEILSEWHKEKDTGGAAVMVIGYEMYRNLLSESKNDFKSSTMETLRRTLAHPGVYNIYVKQMLNIY